MQAQDNLITWDTNCHHTSPQLFLITNASSELEFNQKILDQHQAESYDKWAIQTPGRTANLSETSPGINGVVGREMV